MKREATRCLEIAGPLMFLATLAMSVPIAQTIAYTAYYWGMWKESKAYNEHAESLGFNLDEIKE